MCVCWGGGGEMRSQCDLCHAHLCVCVGGGDETSQCDVCHAHLCVCVGEGGMSHHNVTCVMHIYVCGGGGWGVGGGGGGQGQEWDITVSVTCDDADQGSWQWACWQGWMTWHGQVCEGYGKTKVCVGRGEVSPFILLLNLALWALAVLACIHTHLSMHFKHTATILSEPWLC